MDFLPFKQVDVFTRKPFFGNPVAVVFEAAKLSDSEMQRIAAWTNLSETTFVLPPSTADADYRLRIFTPKQELPFAGHPTIGSAHAVLESGIAHARAGRLKQECLAGIVDLVIEESRDGTRIFLRAPQAKIQSLDRVRANQFSNCINSQGKLSPLRVDVGVTWLVAELSNEETIAAITPRLDQIQALSADMQASGITIFAPAKSGELHVRSFAPLLGANEDPVCGSGNAAVAAYLIETDRIGEVGYEYIALQGMALGRAGEVAVRVRNGEIEIGGFAVTCVDARLRTT